MRPIMANGDEQVLDAVVDRYSSPMCASMIDDLLMQLISQGHTVNPSGRIEKGSHKWTTVWQWENSKAIICRITATFRETILGQHIAHDYE